MKNKGFVSIPTPCTQDWDKMSEYKEGKFCNSCQHVVVDFTIMTDSEIKQYLLQRKEFKTCGRLSEIQTNTRSTAREKFFDRLYNRVERNVKFSYIKVIFIYCLTIMSILSGCSRRGKMPHKVGKVSPNYYEIPDSSKFRN